MRRNDRLDLNEDESIARISGEWDRACFDHHEFEQIPNSIMDNHIEKIEQMLLVHWTVPSCLPNLLDEGFYGTRPAGFGAGEAQEHKKKVVCLYPLFEDENEPPIYNCWAMRNFDVYDHQELDSYEEFIRKAKEQGPEPFADMILGVIVDVPDDLTVWVGAWGYTAVEPEHQCEGEFSAGNNYKVKTTFGEFKQTFFESLKELEEVSDGRYDHPRNLLESKTWKHIKEWEFPDWQGNGFELFVERHVPPEWITGAYRLQHPRENWFSREAYREGAYDPERLLEDHQED